MKLTAFWIFLFTLFISPCVAQETLCDLMKKSVIQNSIAVLDSFLLTVPEDDLLKQANVHSVTALALANMRKKSKKSNPDRALYGHQAKKRSNQAVILSKGSDDELLFRYRRHAIGEKMGFEDLANKDLPELKQYGYKDETSGVGFQIVASYNSDFWLGAEVSLPRILFPTYKLIDNRDKQIAQRKLATVATFLNIGYQRNLNQPGSDVFFNVVSIEMPLTLRVLQFGRQSIEDRSTWYYRPEIGVGIYPFNVSYSYSFYFKDEIEALPGHRVGLRYFL